jgi:hypothetical protein
MTEWLLSIQSSDGWFPGGVYRAGGPHTASVFNTGQILFGLTEAARFGTHHSAQAAGSRAAAWLRREQDASGNWSAHAYQAGFRPSYYAHVAWPLAEYAVFAGDDEAADTAVRCARSVLRDRQPDGSFSAWGFRSGAPAFTHTIGYTIQGLIETALLLDRWDEIGAPAADSAYELLRRAERSGKLAGAYGPGWKADFRFVCLTGNCQMASAWMALYERERDVRFLNAALRALEQVAAAQRMSGRAFRRGAIAGSSPVWGAYMRLRYPNWAAKFFVDALAQAEVHLTALEAAGAPEPVRPRP